MNFLYTWSAQWNVRFFDERIGKRRKFPRFIHVFSCYSRQFADGILLNICKANSPTRIDFAISWKVFSWPCGRWNNIWPMVSCAEDKISILPNADRIFPNDSTVHRHKNSQITGEWVASQSGNWKIIIRSRQAWTVVDARPCCFRIHLSLSTPSFQIITSSISTFFTSRELLLQIRRQILPFDSIRTADSILPAHFASFTLANYRNISVQQAPSLIGQYLHRKHVVIKFWFHQFTAALS